MKGDFNMNSNQLGNHRAMISFGMATLLALIATPTLASDDPGRPADQPITCCVVVPGDQGMYSGDCLGPGEFPRLPFFIAQPQGLPRFVGVDEAIGPDDQLGTLKVELPPER